MSPALQNGAARLRKLLVDEGYFFDWLTAIILIIISVAIPNHAVDTANRVAHPDDPSLMYPFRDSTVSNAQLMAITFAVPVAAFSLAQIIHRSLIDWHHACLSLIEGFSIAFTLKRWLNLVGRYRPDWFARLAQNAKVGDGRLAYPSGHATFSMLGMALLSCYALGKLQLLSRPSKGAFPKALLAISPIAFAVWVAATRLANYKHDFSDVNAGMFIGLVSALFAYFLNFNSFFSPASAEPRCQGREAWATGFSPAGSPVQGPLVYDPVQGPLVYGAGPGGSQPAPTMEAVLVAAEYSDSGAASGAIGRPSAMELQRRASLRSPS